MRLPKQQADCLKQLIQDQLPGAAVYLFGSRVDDCRKGGDIDIMVVGPRKLSGQEQRNIKIAFYKRFGMQKIDLVSFDDRDRSSFKKTIDLESVKL